MAHDLNDLKAIHEIDKRIPSIIELIKEVNEDYEANTSATGMVFLHMLFDAFVDSQKLDREKSVY